MKDVIKTTKHAKKKKTSDDKCKREKAKVREGLGRFLIKSEAERDVECELQHPFYCPSHMRRGKKITFCC